MTKQRSKYLMKRAGLTDDLLARCQTLEEFNAELAKLSYAQLLAAWERTQGERATRLSDEELLTELDVARREEREQDTNTNRSLK